MFIQPIIAVEDKPRIGEFLHKAPADLKHLLSATDFIHLVSEVEDRILKILSYHDPSPLSRGSICIHRIVRIKLTGALEWS